MAEVLNNLLGLPVTPDAVDVLEGRQCAPSDALDGLHYPLVADDVIAVPGFDTARQDVLNGASVEVHEGLRGKAEFLQPPGVK